MSAGAPADGGIHAVVVTHASEESIDECLLRLRASRGVVAIRVVDNASADATLSIVQRHALADARVRFIANPDNPGFATACNQGAADATAPWLAFVNPDCLPEADAPARGGIVAALLVHQVGGFDAGYRLHAEDLDLCRRVREAGVQVACANDVCVLHLRGVSSRRRPLFVEWHKHRGLWRYFRRFEAAQCAPWQRAAVFALVWGRFPFAALRATGRALVAR